MIRDELEACSKEKFPIAEADRLRLKDELGEDSFIRFNQYVNQRHWIPVAPRGPNPCPANHNPPPGQTTHLACTEFYVCFFEDFSKTDTWNQAMIRDGRNAETQVFNTFIPLPEAKKKADIALGLNAARDIKESFEETGASSQGPGTPGGRPREVIEEYIARLRQVLGEKQFREFDEILSGENNSMPSPVSAPAASGPGVPQ
jgi:hypothetical protein